MPDDFSPEHTVDRDIEQDEFQKLLQFNDDARLLAIHDKGGSGKSTLLRKLHHNCQVMDPPIPASLVKLEETKTTLTTSFALIDRIKKDLSDLVAFKAFDDCNTKRLRKDPAVFGLPSVVGTVLLGGATISGTDNKIIGTAVQTPQVTNLNYNANGAFPWGDEQEEYARDECVKAFFADLKSIGDQQSCVILFDAYEQCQATLRDWIFHKLLRPLCFDVESRPRRVVFVVAGQALPGFNTLGQVKHDQCVRSRNSLNPWERENVNKVLTLHGYNLDEDRFSYIWNEVSHGQSIRGALLFADFLSRQLPSMTSPMSMSST